MLSFSSTIRFKSLINHFYMAVFLLLGHKIFKPKTPKLGKFNQEEIDFYDFKLHPAIAEIEQKRRATLNKFRIKFVLWVAIAGIIWFKSHFIFALIFLFVLHPVVFYKLKSYQKQMHSLIVPKMLAYFGDDFIYDHDAKMADVNEAYKYGIIPDCNKVKVEDYIAGQLDGRPFILFELKLSNVTIQNKNQEKEYKVFEGLCICIEFEKKFKQRTIALPRGDRPNTKALKNEKMMRVKLEGIGFEKKFDLYGQNQIESRYIFTPSFMDRLCNLKDALDAREIKCSFYKNCVQILLTDNRSHFKIGTIFKPVDFVDEFYSIICEMNYIKEIARWL